MFEKIHNWKISKIEQELCDYANIPHSSYDQSETVGNNGDGDGNGGLNFKSIWQEYKWQMLLSRLL